MLSFNLRAKTVRSSNLKVIGLSFLEVSLIVLAQSQFFTLVFLSVHHHDNSSVNGSILVISCCHQYLPKITWVKRSDNFQSFCGAKTKIIFCKIIGT